LHPTVASLGRLNRKLCGDPFASQARRELMNIFLHE
jgi:hypothetical protein